MFFSCGVIANFVFFVTKMLIPQGGQHSLTPVQFDAGIHVGIFTLSRVEFAIYLYAVVLKEYAKRYHPSSLLGHETHETRREVETGKFSMGKKYEKDRV